MSQRTIHRITSAAGNLHRSTSETIEHAHQQLCDEDPGDPPAAVRARARAGRVGWEPATPLPRDDIDPVAVQRAIDGRPVTLTRPERDAALHELAGRHPDGDIAARLSISDRTVLRLRTTHCLPAYESPRTNHAHASPAPEVVKVPDVAE